MSLKLTRAFELQGQVREKLTALQTLAADLDDTNLSRSLQDAMRANTAGIARTNELLQMSKTTAALDASFAGEHVESGS